VARFVTSGKGYPAFLIGSEPSFVRHYTVHRYDRLQRPGPAREALAAVCSMLFEIHKNDDDGTYSWEAKDEEQRTLAASPPMPSKGACVAAILILKHGAARANVYDQTVDSSGPIEERRIVM